MEIIPILRDLTGEQFENLLSICTKQELLGYTVIFKEGDQSRDMYILTEGFLKVTFRGKEVSRIYPVSTVGEMGIFTEETRSATVTTMTKCSLLRIMKNDLLDLFEKDKDFYIKFQKAMLLDLSNKMRMTNEVVVKLRSKLDKLP